MTNNFLMAQLFEAMNEYNDKFIEFHSSIKHNVEEIFKEDNVELDSVYLDENSCCKINLKFNSTKYGDLHDFIDYLGIPYDSLTIDIYDWSYENGTPWYNIQLWFKLE